MRRYQKKRKRRPNWGPFQPGTLPRPDGSLHPDEVWLNDAYQVLVTWFDCLELGVKSMRQLAERECRPLAPDQEGITCDWGGGCHALAVAERFSTTHGWLPVCEACRTADIKDG